MRGTNDESVVNSGSKTANIWIATAQCMACAALAFKLFGVAFFSPADVTLAVFHKTLWWIFGCSFFFGLFCTGSAFRYILFSVCAFFAVAVFYGYWGIVATLWTIPVISAATITSLLLRRLMKH